MDFRYLTDRKFSNALAALPNDFNILAMALESTNSGVVITDNQQPDNPIIFCNHAFENLSGYSREEILGQNCRFLQRSDKDQQSLSLLRSCISEGESVIVEIRNYHRDGTMFWNELSIAPVRDNEGKVTHFIGVQNDVTAKKVMESDLMEQIDRLNNRLEKQDKYLRKIEEIVLGILKSTQDSIVILDKNLTIVKANSNFYNTFHETEGNIIKKNFGQILDGQWNDPELHDLLKAVITKNQAFDEFKVTLAEQDNCRQALIKGKSIQVDGIKENFILLTIHCIHENELQQANAL